MSEQTLARNVLQLIPALAGGGGGVKEIKGGHHFHAYIFSEETQGELLM